MSFAQTTLPDEMTFWTLDRPSRRACCHGYKDTKGAGHLGQHSLGFSESPSSLADPSVGAALLVRAPDCLDAPAVASLFPFLGGYSDGSADTYSNTHTDSHPCPMLIRGDLTHLTHLPDFHGVMPPL